MVKAPHDDTVEFPLSVLATFNGSPSHIGRRVSVQPLLAKHRKEGREKCSGETGVKDGLDLDYRARRACPLWEGGSVVSEGGVVDLVDEDTEESGGLITRVGLELRLDVDDEGRSDGGEQTSLWPE